jgi:hypothetical protein
VEAGAYGRGRVGYKCDGQLAKDAAVSRDRCYGTNSNFCLRFNGGMVAREVVVGWMRQFALAVRVPRWLWRKNGSRFSFRFL